MDRSGTNEDGMNENGSFPVHDLGFLSNDLLPGQCQAAIRSVIADYLAGLRPIGQVVELRDGFELILGT